MARVLNGSRDPSPCQLPLLGLANLKYRKDTRTTVKARCKIESGRISFKKVDEGRGKRKQGRVRNEKAESSRKKK